MPDASDPGVSAPVHGGAFPDRWNVVDVKGDVISVNWVKQYTFATDFDRAEIQISGADTYIGLGENVVTNVTSILEFGYDYDLILVGGDMITMNVISQINVLLDRDTITGPVPPGADLSASDDLQMNRAEIEATSTDTVIAMKDSFRSALDDLANGVRDLAQDVVHDARFAGEKFLSVLRIEGNLTRLNLVEQIDVLRGFRSARSCDAEPRRAGRRRISVVAGSNAQLNAARIVEAGQDWPSWSGGRL